ncbi:MAG: hypothetical protein ACJ735_02940 [Actinomycetes bacterium]
MPRFAIMITNVRSADTLIAATVLLTMSGGTAMLLGTPSSPRHPPGAAAAHQARPLIDDAVRDAAIHLRLPPAPAAHRAHVSTHRSVTRTAVSKPVRRAAAHRAAKRIARPATIHAPSGPTSWPALNVAIARIPTYRSGEAEWVVKNTGWWGTADWGLGVIYISPTVPVSKLYDVAVHEWSHLLTVRDYGGNVQLATQATAAYFGGTGLNGAEDAADCMAIVQGADWTHYTRCASSHWRDGARLLVEGRTLPA